LKAGPLGGIRSGGGARPGVMVTLLAIRLPVEGLKVVERSRPALFARVDVVDFPTILR